MIDIIVVGEDAVTREIAKRLLFHSTNSFNIIREDPLRGSQLKPSIPQYNNLGLPVCVLTDLDDADCPPSLIEEWFKGTPISTNLVFNIARDEAESWLMADRAGFAAFLVQPPAELSNKNPCSV